ncbi:holo-[acyl-carrier-protein] synthase [Kluyveromyces marxianus]|nr:holo-[acyl-carrier-protein] synthase [Kluyveromyces marxianus]KAG0682380.1 holo-[acyl-carrier-protein] synthase [Kluyveromyces marxianus]
MIQEQTDVNIQPQIYICDVEDGWLADDFNFESAMRLLSLEEQIQVLRKRSKKLQRMALGNRLLQLHGCSSILGVKPGDLEFSRGSFGKPMVKGMEFSMSNGERHCVMGIHYKPVGVDIASTTDCNGMGSDYVTAFRDIFTDSEFRWLSDSTHRDLLFSLLWSMKEAYMKLIGTGLNTDIQAIDVGSVPVYLEQQEAVTTQRTINGELIAFSSRWITDTEVVSTAERTTAAQSGIENYRIVRVTPQSIVDALLATH